MDVDLFRDNVDLFRKALKPFSNVQDPDMRGSNPSKTESKVSFGGIDVFRGEVEVNKIAFEGSEDGKQGYKIEVDVSEDEVDVCGEEV